MQNPVEKLTKLFADPASLLGIEGELRSYLREFINFDECAVFFHPGRPAEIVYLEDESRLIIPVGEDASILLTGIDNNEIRAFMPIIPQLVSICISRACLVRALNLDLDTGLANEETFYNFLEKEAEIVQGDADSGSRGKSLHRLCMAMIVLNWPQGEIISHDMGYDCASGIFYEIAGKLASLIPEDGIFSRLGKFERKFELGVFMHAQGNADCARLLEKFSSALEGSSFFSVSLQKTFSPRLEAGIAFYPQDMKGTELVLSKLEQALLLRDRARLAATFAGQLSRPFLGYQSILRSGGIVLANLDGSRLKINLGHEMNVRKGAHFNVLSQNGVETRGRIVISDVSGNHSIADVLYVPDANFPPAPGDILVPLEDMESMGQQCSDIGGRFLPYDQFFEKFNQRHDSKFTLALCEFENCDAQTWARGEADLLAILDSGEPKPLFCGKYENRSLVFYHDDLAAADCYPFYLDLTNAASRHGIVSYCGIYEFPSLDYLRSDSEGCVLKALDYARLLPYPHIGIFDSVALNISGDKFSSQGENFKAIAEYERAIMANPANALAHNSLGVILANMGRDTEASRHFKKGLRETADTALQAKICYNLGALHEKLEKWKAAEAFYRRCSQLDDTHGFSLLRLGKMYEKNKNFRGAKNAYKNAMNLAGAQPEIANTAQKHLAGLLAETDPDEATELLHGVLLRNPEDMGTLLLLARLYMKSDPGIAEMLARKGVEQGAGEKGWILLAEALERQDRNKEACAVKLMLQTRKARN